MTERRVGSRMGAQVRAIEGVLQALPRHKCHVDRSVQRTHSRVTVLDLRTVRPFGEALMLLTTPFALVGALRRARARYLDTRTCRLPLLSALLGASILAGAVLVSAPDIVLSHDRGDEGRLNRHVRSGQITWTPASMIEECGLGQTKSQTVSFSSAENLVNVEIYVSPELRRLVRVHPTRFQRVDHGQSISVSITIAASATTSLGKASGSVQLVRNDLRPEGLFESLPVTVLVTAAPLSPDPGAPGRAILAGGR
jgi:hypothetical protein